MCIAKSFEVKVRIYPLILPFVLAARLFKPLLWPTQNFLWGAPMSCTNPTKNEETKNMDFFVNYVLL